MSRPEVRAGALPPVLSVVIAASDSAAAVARTLAALDRQRGAGRVEVIVAAPCDRIAAPRQRSPAGAGALGDIRWVSAAPGTSVPRLRRLGFAEATAPVVAFTEDSCIFEPDWAEAWVVAFADACLQGATGPVAAAMGPAAIDWAVFLCEYAPFVAAGGSGAGAGPPARLAGNNFAVRRSACGALDGPEIHETEVAGALAGQAGALVGVAGARARHVRRYALREAIGDRLRFGHAYGRLRAGHWTRALRLAGLLAGPAILGVQAARLTALVVARRRFLGEFLEGLPVTVGLLSAWSVGEWLGWLARAVSFSDWAGDRKGESDAVRTCHRLSLFPAELAHSTTPFHVPERPATIIPITYSRVSRQPGHHHDHETHDEKQPPDLQG